MKFILAALALSLVVTNLKAQSDMYPEMEESPEDTYYSGDQINTEGFQFEDQQYIPEEEEENIETMRMEEYAPGEEANWNGYTDDLSD